MGIRLSVCRAGHPAGFEKYFDAGTLDAFHTAAVMHLLHGDRWYSTLIEDGEHAWLHSFAVSRIADTGQFDVEPWLGYSGPLTNADLPEFIELALREYSQWCRSAGIVAELIRFNPLLNNAAPLLNRAPNLKIIDDKLLVYIGIEATEDAQLASYSKPCQRRIRAARPCLRFVSLDPRSDQWDQFLALYLSSLERVGAQAHWRFDAPFFERLRDHVLWFGVTPHDEPERLVSTVAVLVGTPVAYSFLGGNDDLLQFKGANDLLIHGVARALAERGLSWYCQGGGNTTDENDPLLIFKRKFSRTVLPFPIGFFAHATDALDALYIRAGNDSEAARTSRLFLRYRESCAFSSGRMKSAVLDECVGASHHG